LINIAWNYKDQNRLTAATPNRVNDDISLICPYTDTAGIEKSRPRYRILFRGELTIEESIFVSDNGDVKSDC
jgi:hypothetical protein